MANDDFWYESQVKTSAANTFTFDDRESGGGYGGEFSSLQMCGISLDGTSQLFQQVQAGLLQDGRNNSSLTDTKLPTHYELNKLISEKVLNCFLDADSPQYFAPKSVINPTEEVRVLRRQLENIWVAPDAKVTAQKMMLKQPFMLEMFRSLESKKQLLNEVILLGDGDSISAVIVFLSWTLKKTYLNQILMEQPDAANHYVSYLATRQRISELTDILEMLGQSQDASMKQFEVAVRSPQLCLHKLIACAKNHSFNTRNSQLVNSYIKFLEWQKESGLGESESVTDCLQLLCEKHWGEAKAPKSPMALTQLQAVGDKQFQWTAITARAKVKAWQDIQTLLTAKSWLGGAKLRVCLPPEHILSTLHASGAPQDLLYTFLQLIDNVEKRLAIAQTIACDRAIIEASIALREKSSSAGRKLSLQSS